LLQKEVSENGIEHSLLFFKAQACQARKVKEVLDMYATSTGQPINPSKCYIRFGEACPVLTRLEVKGVLEVTQEATETKYLGLPTPEGTMDKGKFQSLQARLAKCPVEWDDIDKLQAAKEILIKDISHIIPLYVMSL
jgi:hypothetical protein